MSDERYIWQRGDVIVPERQDRKHLPGQHDQADHGNRGGGGEEPATEATTTNLGTAVGTLVTAAAEDAASLGDIQSFQAEAIAPDAPLAPVLDAAQRWQGQTDEEGNSTFAHNRGETAIPGLLGWQENVDLVQAQLAADGQLESWTCPNDGVEATAEQLQQAAEDAKSLASAIDAAPPTEQALYRGMAVVGMDSATAEETFAVGERFEVPVGSFSGEPGIAGMFANLQIEGGMNEYLLAYLDENPDAEGPIEMPPAAGFVFVLEEGAQAIPLRPLADTQAPGVDELINADEWLAGGTYEVTSIEVAGSNGRGDNMYEVQIRQVRP